MPELRVGEQRLTVDPASNLLDALLAGGVAVPYSCRAGSCHACLVRCLHGEPLDAKPEALDGERRELGWRLACQCRVVDDLQVEVFDPMRDGRAARIDSCDWLSPNVLRLRLTPLQALRYRAGQHLVLWTEDGVARPYSLASLPGEDPWLEFHLDCRQRGAFSDAARAFRPGDGLRLGELRGGALHYDPDWQARPLWLLAAGTGLAPLYGILREALRQEHQGSIRVIHLAQDDAEHYLAEPLAELAAVHPQLRVEQPSAAQLPEALAELRLVARKSLALLCGHPQSVETFARRLYLAGVPRNQVFADLFLPHA
jgi:NAD(P)H-flavin reductase/ferredoxin